MKRFRTSPKTFSQTFPENFVAAGRNPVKKFWRSGASDPRIESSGDLLPMMVQSENALEEEACERRAEERAAEPPPRQVIISINGRDVEEREIPKQPRKPRAA